MGSICRHSALERYNEKHGKELLEKYEKLLLGKRIISMSGVGVDYWINADVTLDDGEVYNTHFRWSGENEQNSNREYVGKGEIGMKKYYKQNILKRGIKSIEIGFDRDDMLYCYAIVDKPNSNHCIEIPIIDLDEIYEIEEKEEELTEDDYRNLCFASLQETQGKIHQAEIQECTWEEAFMSVKK